MKIINKVIDSAVQRKRDKNKQPFLKGNNKLARKMYRNQLRETMRKLRLKELRK
jgi:hypothetical protein